MPEIIVLSMIYIQKQLFDSEDYIFYLRYLYLQHNNSQQRFTINSLYRSKKMMEQYSDLKLQRLLIDESYKKLKEFSNIEEIKKKEIDDLLKENENHKKTIKDLKGFENNNNLIAELRLLINKNKNKIESLDEKFIFGEEYDLPEKYILMRNKNLEDLKDQFNECVVTSIKEINENNDLLVDLFISAETAYQTIKKQFDKNFIKMKEGYHESVDKDLKENDINSDEDEYQEEIKLTEGDFFIQPYIDYLFKNIIYLLVKISKYLDNYVVIDINIFGFSEDLIENKKRIQTIEEKHNSKGEYMNVNELNDDFFDSFLYNVVYLQYGVKLYQIVDIYQILRYQIFLKLIMIYYSHTDMVCYLFMVIMAISFPTVFNILFVLIAFSFAAISYPYPPQKYWNYTSLSLSILIAYQYILFLILKIMKFYNYSFSPNYESYQILGFSPTSSLIQTIIFNFIVIYIISHHRDVLKTRGDWRSKEIKQKILEKKKEKEKNQKFSSYKVLKYITIKYNTLVKYFRSVVSEEKLGTDLYFVMTVFEFFSYIIFLFSYQFFSGRSSDSM
jgi:hypothetical protein